eukprot:CAMPEP_0170557756 /NCGR_PEP_ID=MMETSP0211-20121228/29842_1 /TAXON_ID=311385 /ORGANISM="Pseudokeronopsis sp., Strain OXSARD2" /LENGTH=99 /DNA_ID=CAMNT_0010869059 /DNA_START=150 /DNA_END=449 /DNA_ORIENTATION=-
MIVFSIDNRRSFDDCLHWISEIRINATEKTKIMLIGNKYDLEEKRVISVEEAQDFAKKYDIEYMETSAKTSFNVYEAFKLLGTMAAREELQKTPNEKQG